MCIRDRANLVERLNKASTAYDMEISAEKTKLNTNNPSGINIEIKVNVGCDWLSAEGACSPVECDWLSAEGAGSPVGCDWLSAEGACSTVGCKWLLKERAVP